MRDQHLQAPNVAGGRVARSPLARWLLVSTLVVGVLALWHRDARADWPPPDPPWSVAVIEPGGSFWTSHNDFHIKIGEPLWPAGRSPIIAAWIRICPADTQQPCGPWNRFAVPPDEQEPTVDGVTVPGSGEWTARVALEDQGGDVSFDRYTETAPLRFDGDAPTVTFNPLDPHDPVLLSAQAHDPLSGLQWAHIGLAPHGMGNWRWFDTSSSGDSVEARVDDAVLPDGQYDEAVEAFDFAGNRSLVLAPRPVSIPLRAITRLSGGIVSPSGRIAARLGMTRGQVATVTGTLRRTDGQPIVGAEIAIRARLAASHSPTNLTGVETTDDQGRFSHRLAATASTRLLLSYNGDDFRRPSRGTASLIVPAQSTIRVNRHAAVDGSALRLHGELRGGHVPARGKLVLLERRTSRGWAAVNYVRSSPSGTWRASTRVRQANGRVQRYRVYVPRDAAYPFEPASTAAVHVRVVGR